MRVVVCLSLSPLYCDIEDAKSPLDIQACLAREGGEGMRERPSPLGGLVGGQTGRGSVPATDPSYGGGVLSDKSSSTNLPPTGRPQG